MKRTTGSDRRPSRVLLTTMVALLQFHLAAMPCLSQDIQTNTAASDIDTPLPGKAALTSVGPLQMPEGVAIFKDAGITVLSNALDPVTEAELTGSLLNVHQVAEADGQQMITGFAMFVAGPSLSALDDKQKDSETVQLVSGKSVVGHIESIDATKVRMTTAQGTRDLNVNDIAIVTSPHAFEFSIPASAPKSTTLPVIKFHQTTNTGVHHLAIVRATMYESPTSKHPIRKRAILTAASVAGLFFCYAIPAAVAVSTKHLGGLKGDL